MKLIQREYKAIIIGAVVYGVFSTTTELLKNYLIKDFKPIDSPYFEILNFILQILATVSIALPGYVAGRLSIRSGTINGILLMFVCTNASFFIFHFNSLSSSKVFFNIVIYFSVLLLPVTVGALSGAAGQYHRDMRNRL